MDYDQIVSDAKDILAGNVASTCRVRVYGLKYQVDIDELFIRNMAINALETPTELTVVEKNKIGSFLKTPYDN